MKNSRRYVFLIFLLLSLVLLKPIKLETKIAEKNEIILSPEAMGVYEKWNYSTAGQIQFSPLVADLDGNAELEIIVCSTDKIYCLDNSGSQVWNYTAGNVVRSTPVFADLDSDSKMEIVVGCVDGKLYCLNHNGT